MRAVTVFLITLAYGASQACTSAAAGFSPQAWFAANLKTVESTLLEKHIHYDRTADSVRFLDTDKTSETYGLTIEVFGNLTGRLSGNGKAGWATLEPTGKGSELKVHSFTNNDPAVDEFLLKRTRNFEVITGYAVSTGTGEKIVKAYLFSAYRPTSPTTADLSGGLLVTLNRNGQEHAEVESAEQLQAFNKAEGRMAETGIAGLIGAQAIRTTGQHIRDMRDMRNKQGNYSWMK